VRCSPSGDTRREDRPATGKTMLPAKRERKIIEKRVGEKVEISGVGGEISDDSKLTNIAEKRRKEVAFPLFSESTRFKKKGT